MSNSQLNKLKSGINNVTEVTLNFSLKLIIDSNDQTNFSHKLLLTDRQVSRLRKTFPKNSSANIKLSKTQLSKIAQLGGFLFLEPLKATRFVRESFKNKGPFKSAKGIPKLIFDMRYNILNKFHQLWVQE